LDWKDIEEVRARARRSNDLTEWNGDFSPRTPLFGPVTAGDAEVRLKIAFYSIRFPSFYFPSLVAGGIYQRGAHNLDVYREVRESAGYSGYGTKNGSRELCPEARLGAFTPSPLFDSYLSDTIALFQARNIPVYFIVTPLNEISVRALHAGFAADYGSYIQSFEARYPNFRRLGDPLPTLPWTDFGDPNHLNLEGAGVFSDSVAALLREAQVEK
jgi:hypothetical protein